MENIMKTFENCVVSYREARKIEGLESNSKNLKDDMNEVAKLPKFEKLTVYEFKLIYDKINDNEIDLKIREQINNLK